MMPGCHLNRSSRHLPGFFITLILLCLALAVSSTRAQMIDQNHNGMSDIWEWLYGVYGINPNVDSDGDGFLNIQEATAGTDPLNSNSYPRIAFATVSGTNISILVPCYLGKLYRLQSVTPPATNWIDETNVEAMSGTNLILTSPLTAAMKFYRISISDVDSDGSGLMNDWEKFQLGLDPTNAWSNGQEDANGNALSDYAYTLAVLGQQNVITLSASDLTGIEPAAGPASLIPGAFTITRGGFPLGNLTVKLATVGSGPGYAAPNVDYTALPA